MPTAQEGPSPAPKGVVEEAIASLEKEGHSVEGKQPAPVEPKPVEEPAKEPAIVEPPKEPKAPAPARAVTMVEAWKLNVAEDQKGKALTRVQELEAEVDRLSKQKGPITESQQADIDTEIKAIAEEGGIDAGVLTKVASAILKKANTGKPSTDLEAKVKSLEQERELEKHVNTYNAEFEKDVLPVLKQYNLSDQALSQVKSTLKDLAFSEAYSRIPVSEIFKIKQDSFDLKPPKKSAEGKGPKVRENDVIDTENISEEEFAKLPREQIEAVIAAKTGTSGWNKPGSASRKK
jgi:hypothetical protein